MKYCNLPRWQDLKYFWDPGSEFFGISKAHSSLVMFQLKRVDFHAGDSPKANLWTNRTWNLRTRHFEDLMHINNMFFDFVKGWSQYLTVFFGASSRDTHTHIHIHTYLYIYIHTAKFLIWAQAYAVLVTKTAYAWAQIRNLAVCIYIYKYVCILVGILQRKSDGIGSSGQCRSWLKHGNWNSVAYWNVL